MALGFFESSNDPTDTSSYERLANRRKLLDALMMQKTDVSPVQHWTQGLARMADAAATSYQDAKLKDEEKSNNDYGTGLLAKAMGLGGSNPSPSAPAPGPMADAAPVPPADIPQGGNYRDAIASIESRGSGDYGALGPVTNKGDRAFGRYQVMGSNIGPWSEAALGKRITPEEFMKSPELQDKIFDHVFNGYVQKYGTPQDAASAWFTGRPLAQGGNARDQLGTSGNAYAQKFLAALGQGGGQGAIARAAPNPDLPSPGAQEAGGAPLPPGAAAFAGAPRAMLAAALSGNDKPLSNMPQMAGSDPVLASGKFSPYPQNPDAPAPNAAPAGPAPMPEDPVLAATRARAQNPQPGDQFAPLGSAQEQAATRLEGQPGAAPQAASAPAGADRGKMLLMAALDPRLSPQQRQMAMTLATQMQAENKASYQTLPDGTIIQLDPRGVHPPKPVYQAQTKAQWGVIGEDEYGKKSYGWIDPVTRNVVPGAAPQGSGGAVQGGDPAIPPAPPGVNPKVWRDEKTKELATGGKPLTENEANANALSMRMEKSNAILNQMEKEGTGFWSGVGGLIPGVGNYVTPEKRQVYDQAKRQFINSVLRKESGASISSGEFASADKQYFPQPGDSQKVIDQKREARATATEGVRAAAGKNASKSKPDLADPLGIR